MAQKTNGVVKAFELTNLSTNSELVYYLDFNNLGAVGSPCVWSINLPAIQGQTKRFLKVQSANASVISGTAATYTQSFAIKSNATTGYMDKNGNPTNTLCYVIPKDVNAFVYQDQQFFNITYGQQDSQLWDIGLTTNLSISVTSLGAGGSDTPLLCGDLAPTAIIKVQRILK